MDSAQAVVSSESFLLSAAVAALVCGTLCARPASAQTVSGTGALTPGSVQSPTWTIGAPLIVGDGSDGTLSITGGGSVDNDAGTIGSDATGTVTVSGADGSGNASTWTNGGDLAIGFGGAGQGTLGVDNGGVVNVTDTAYVGLDVGSQGGVTVSGQDGGGNASTWTIGSDLVIGQDGTGRLSILDGALVSNATGYIGAGAGSQGTVIVSGRSSSGTASTWINRDDLRVGDSGIGELTIQDGGFVSVGGDLSIGYNGAGTLNITSGGKAVSNNGSIDGNINDAGRVLVTGGGSSWEATGRITVDFGSLNIEDGATVSSGDGVVGSSAHGDVVVSGPGSSWSNAGQLNIGSFATGTLRIENGASVTSNQGYIGANADGSAVVTGAGSNWRVTDYTMTVGNVGTGTLIVEDGGLVRAEGGFSLGVAAGSSGTVILQGTAANRAVLETRRIAAGVGTVSLTINGGLLRATQNIANFFAGFDMHDITLGANGVVIDTDGHDIGISPRFVGTGDLIKDSAGTLTLSGSNSYVGGTAVNGGTLRISADTNLGDTSGLLSFDGGTLDTTATLTSNRAVTFTGAGTLATGTGTTFTLTGSLSGSGAFAKAGTGTLVFTGDGSGYTGTAKVDAGTLAVNGLIKGSMVVNTAGRLVGTGQVGTLANGGIVAPGFGNAVGTLTVQGDYVGNGGHLEIATALGGDNSPTSRLVVNGAASGITQVDVINRGGLGGQTVEGIKIIEVTGASNGRFVLNSDYLFQGAPAVIAGAYGYRLYQGGVDNPADGDWYLRSALLDPGQSDGAGNGGQTPLYQPGVSVYEGYVANLQSLNTLPTLQQRIGNRSWAAGASLEGNGIWGRMAGMLDRSNPAFSTSASDQDINSWTVQLGVDGVLTGTSNGERLVAGITASYGTADSQIRSVFGNGTIKTSGYSVGATLTWYGLNGFHLDGQAQVSRYSSDLKSGTLGSLTRDNHGHGEAFGVEAGKRISIDGMLSITPQVQMAYSHVAFDQFTDSASTNVVPDIGESLKTRWGVSLDHQGIGENGRSHIYGLVHLSYEWLDGAGVLVSNTLIARAEERMWGEVGVGGSMSWTTGITLYGEISSSSPFRDFGQSYTLRGNVGLRKRF